MLKRELDPRIGSLPTRTYLGSVSTILEIWCFCVDNSKSGSSPIKMSSCVSVSGMSYGVMGMGVPAE